MGFIPTIALLFAILFALLRALAFAPAAAFLKMHPNGDDVHSENQAKHGGDDEEGGFPQRNVTQADRRERVVTR